MQEKYVIRKVVYTGMDCAESYPLDWMGAFNVFGVYEYRNEPTPDGKAQYLLYWCEDFQKLSEAEAYILHKEG